MFNNVTGDALDLAEFVDTGDQEIGAYLQAFGLAADDIAADTLVEIGSGIGRMTAGVHAVLFGQRRSRATSTRRSSSAAGETVAQFGVAERLRTLPRRRRPHAADRRRRRPTSRSATSPCSTASTTTRWRWSREAVRVTKPGGHDRAQLPHVVGRRRAAVAARQGDPRRCGGCPGFGPWLRPPATGDPRSAGRRTGCRRTEVLPARRRPLDQTFATRDLPLAAAPAVRRSPAPTDAHVRRRQPQPLVARRRASVAHRIARSGARSG